MINTMLIVYKMLWADIMENKNIIIILIVAIVVLAAVIGFILMNPTHTKVPCKIKITSDKEQYKGGKLSVKLTGLNNTPLSKEVVNITVTDKNGKVVVDKVVKTNSKGKATLDLKLKKGNYKVNVTYGGNENYTGDNATQKLKIKEKKQVEKSTNNEEQGNHEESSSPSSGLHYDEEINVYYNDEGIVVDPDGQHSQSVGYSYSDLRETRDRWERGEPVMV